MKTAYRYCLASCCWVLLATGCGTVSKIQPAEAPASTNATSMDARKYDAVAILDFEDQTKPKTGDSHEAERAAQAQAACRQFADRIAAELRKRKAFQTVKRGPSEGEALVIEGSMTRFTPGNAALRGWIGFGAGSSYFDATVRFSDNQSGKELGTLLVDKNSWALGGGMASGQTVERYMSEAARKIAVELEVAKGSARRDQPSPGPDEAVVYFLRPGRFVGCAATFDIKQNDQVIGALSNSSYFFIHVDPGEYKYSSPGKVAAPPPINAEAGKRYYIRLNAKLGGSEMIQIPESEASALIPKLKLRK
jgi:hypothetical protein